MSRVGWNPVVTWNRNRCVGGFKSGEEPPNSATARWNSGRQHHVMEWLSTTTRREAVVLHQQGLCRQRFQQRHSRCWSFWRSTKKLAKLKIKGNQWNSAEVERLTYYPSNSEDGQQWQKSVGPVYCLEKYVQKSLHGEGGAKKPNLWHGNMKI